MKPPKDALAFPPKRRRSVSFNTTVSLLQSEIAKAAAELAKLAPENGEITYRIKGEVRAKRAAEKEALNLQISWSIEAIEDGKR